jgi:hypothetical protein
MIAHGRAAKFFIVQEDYSMNDPEIKILADHAGKAMGTMMVKSTIRRLEMYFADLDIKRNRTKGMVFR